MLLVTGCDNKPLFQIQSDADRVLSGTTTAQSLGYTNADGVADCLALFNAEFDPSTGATGSHVCSNTCTNIQKCGTCAPTPAPTALPTLAPTAVPTDEPTSAPTPAPTETPTAAPPPPGAEERNDAPPNSPPPLALFAPPPPKCPNTCTYTTYTRSDYSQSDCNIGSADEQAACKLLQDKYATCQPQSLFLGETVAPGKYIIIANGTTAPQFVRCLLTRTPSGSTPLVTSHFYASKDGVTVDCQTVSNDGGLLAAELLTYKINKQFNLCNNPCSPNTNLLKMQCTGIPGKLWS